MPGYKTISKNFIDSFIKERVIRQGLDERTEKAYRQDLEHFCAWMEEIQNEDLFDRTNREMDSNCNRELDKSCLEDCMEMYLKYLVMEKKLSSATVCRKGRVLGYYLSYLSGHGIISHHRSLRVVKGLDKRVKKRESLSKKESEAFFAAMNQEYENLESEFRKRICLRDRVMMEILFYHKIEISELLRLEVSDYEKATGVLRIRRKKGENSEVSLFSQGLRGRIEKWEEERKAFQREGEYEERMFISKFGKPLSMKMVIKIFEKYREMARIEKEFTPKDLKESCMKQYAKELVMERCG